MLFLGKIEHFWEWLPIWKSCILISKLVEVWIKKAAQWCWSKFWVILQKLRDVVDCFSWSAVSEHLLPRKWSNLWESILFIVRIHSLNTFFRWRSKDLYNFD